MNFKYKLRFYTITINRYQAIFYRFLHIKTLLIFILLRLNIKLTFAIIIFIFIPTPPLFKSGFHSFNTYGISLVIVSLVQLLLPFSSFISVAKIKRSKYTNTLH